MNGEEIRDTFYVLKMAPPGDPVELDIPTATTRDCPFCLSALASSSDSDPFKNDSRSFLFKFSELVTASTMTLQKKVDGVYEDVATLEDDILGTYFPLSFIVDEKNRQYIGYLLDWRLVLLAHGTGFYRLETVETNIFGDYTQHSDEYCLLEYTPYRADGTVKIETTTSNLRGDINDPTDIVAFGSGWYQSTRLCGMFGFDTSDYVEERTEYYNGQQKWVKDEQTVKYVLKLRPIPAELHNFVKTDILQADEIIVTDYNKNNPNRHIQQYVNRNGNYEPAWKPKTKLAGVEVNFKSAFNNLRKKQC
jgi:hypothetical protein